MKNVTKVISILLVFLLIFLFTFNTSTYAMGSLNSFNLKEFNNINELALLNDVTIKKNNSNSFSILENGEETIIESEMKDGLVYTYYKNTNNDILDYTVFNPETKETYIDEIQSIISPNDDNISTNDEFTIIENVSEEYFVKNDINLKIGTQAVEKIIKHCPVRGAKKSKNSKISYSSIISTAGAIITVAAFIKAIGAVVGILVLDQVSKLKNIATQTVGMVTTFGPKSPLLSKHGVKIATTFVCKNFYYYYDTQDWRVEGYPSYSFY